MKFVGTRQQIMTIIGLAKEIKLLIQCITGMPNEKYLFHYLYVYISFFYKVFANTSLNNLFC